MFRSILPAAFSHGGSFAGSSRIVGQMSPSSAHFTGVSWELERLAAKQATAYLACSAQASVRLQGMAQVGADTHATQVLVVNFRYLFFPCAMPN